MSHTLEKQIVLGAEALLADPNRWTRGARARTADGFSCRPEDPRAVRWCMIGAMHKAAHQLLPEAGRDTIIAIVKHIAMPDGKKWRVNLVSINDCGGYDKMLETLHELADAL